jgi:putative ABC transport system permease protein
MISLAIAHLRYNRMLSAILILCMTIAVFLPLVTCLSRNMIQEQMTERSDRTPLLIGSKGSPFLLTLNSIYFRTEVQDPITFGTLEKFRDRCRGEVIPLYTGHSAMKHAVVGTSFSYFAFRGLTPAQGRFPATLGEAVAGANAADTLRLEAGGYVITDCENIYDISTEYPLKLRITGILERTGTPDDNVIFADFRTVWIMDGIGHGHEDAIATPEKVHDESIQFIESSEVKYNSRLKKYTEITAKNRDTFHFHGDNSAFPLTALIVIPASHKEKTLVASETRLGPSREEIAAGGVHQLQVVEPSRKIAEILELLLDFKRVLDGFSGLVLLSTAAFLFLVLSLLFRLRRDEMEIIYKIGGSRHAMEMLLGIETAILLAVSFLLAGALSFVVIAGAQSVLFP